mgnify:CR=1 FL=1
MRTDVSCTLFLTEPEDYEGGELVIERRESDGHVLMTGPVELEFEGVFAPAIFQGAA